MMLLMAGLFSTTAVFSQDVDNTDKRASYFSLGPVAGFGHNWVCDMDNQSFKPSGYLGVGALYSKHEHWGVGGLLTASHEGFTQKVYANGNEYINTIDPTYLRLTPRAYYFFGDFGDNVRPKIYAGPSVAYKLTEDTYMDEPAMMTDGVYRMPEGEIINDFDFGVNAGLGANIKLSTHTWLNLDADYYHGLTNVTNDNNKNRSVRANVGVLFGL